ncbi:MAG: sigma-54 interaction domain-containing protein [Myxococcota bacterium]
MPQLPPPSGLGALESVFEALGRVLVVLDADQRVVRVSRSLDSLACAGATERVRGMRAEDLLGPGLFGPGEPIGEALRKGRREEGRRAILRCGDGGRLVSVTAAPLPDTVAAHCDPRARWILVLRPAEEEDLLVHAALGGAGLVARSPAMLRVVHMVDSLQRSDVPVLITGESGTGKEVVARALHARSVRSHGPFVAINCGALPGELLESELFGHVRGAFTGAVRDRVGRFEAARGGTLFLDEIGEMPPALQVKLLRVLQDGRYERVGENATRQLEARVVAATNADLEDAIERGTFREDLYYRLCVVPIHVPPLRERPEDVAPLAHFVAARINRRDGRALRLAPDLLRVMEHMPWPGNVRELENALEYAFVVCDGETIYPQHLPAHAPRRAANDGESGRIRSALEAARWNRADAADALGMSRTTLWRKMRAHGLA